MEVIYSSVLHNIQIDFAAASVPIKWVPEILSSGVKRPGREAEDSPPPTKLSMFTFIARTGTSLPYSFDCVGQVPQAVPSLHALLQYWRIFGGGLTLILLTW